MLVGMLLALAACGKEEGGVADTASTTEMYTSVQELLLMGEYQKAEARIDSMHRAPSLTKEQRRAPTAPTVTPQTKTVPPAQRTPYSAAGSHNSWT